MSIRKILLIFLALFVFVSSLMAQDGKKVEAILNEIDPWVRTDTTRIMNYIDSSNTVTMDYIMSSKYWDPVVEELSFLLGIDFIDGTQITNDGRIYFTMRITGDKAALFYMDGPMGWPIQVTPNSWTEEGITISGFYVHPNGEYLIVQTHVNGDERMDLWYFDKMGHFRPLLIDRNTGFYFAGFDRENPDRFFVLPYDRKTFRIGEYNLASDVFDTLYYEPGIYFPGDYYNGKMTIIRQFGGSMFQVGLYDLASNEITALTDTAIYSSPSFTEEGKILVLTDAESDKDEFTKLCLLDPAKPKDLKVIYDPEYEIDSYFYDRHLKIIYLNLNKDGYSLPKFIDLKGKEIPFPETGIGIVSSVSTNDSGDVVFTFVSPNVAPRAYQFKLGETDKELVAKVSTFGYDFSDIDVQVIRYPSEDGTLIPALVYIPKSAKKDGNNPAIVEYHGGPAQMHRPYFQRNLAFALSKGIIFVRPNVRGSSGYGPAWEQADNLEGRFTALKDAEYAIDYLINEGWSKPEKIAIWGGSYGGYTVDWLAGNAPDKFAVAISLVGVSHPDHTIEYSNPVFIPYWNTEYGPMGSELIRKAAPIFYAENVSKPILVTAGFNDPRVPPSDPRRYAYVLNKLGKKVWYYEEIEAGHGSSGKKQVIRDLAMQYVFTMMYIME